MEGHLRDRAHAEPTADAALDRLWRRRSPKRCRKVTFWKRTWRTWHGYASAGLERRSEHRSRKSAVFGVPKAAVRCSTRSPIWRATTLNRGQERSDLLDRAENDKRSSGIILEALEKDAAPEVRKKAVFALSQLKDDAGCPRSWSAYEDEPDAARGAKPSSGSARRPAPRPRRITDRIDNDPNTEVKKKAVFH